MCDFYKTKILVKPKLIETCIELGFLVTRTFQHLSARPKSLSARPKSLPMLCFRWSWTGRAPTTRGPAELFSCQGGTWSLNSYWVPAKQQCYSKSVVKQVHLNPEGVHEPLRGQSISLAQVHSLLLRRNAGDLESSKILSSAANG